MYNADLVIEYTRRTENDYRSACPIYGCSFAVEMVIKLTFSKLVAGLRLPCVQASSEMFLIPLPGALLKGFYPNIRQLDPRSFLFHHLPCRLEADLQAA